LNYTSFIPTFIIFFSKFSFFPPSISLINSNSKLFNKRFFLLNNFAKITLRLKYFKQYRKIETINWTTNIDPFNCFQYHYELNESTELFLVNNLKTNFNFYTWIFSSLNHLRFLYSFFCERLNKKLYKYSNYKRPRFSLKFFFIPRYKRLKNIIKFISKTVTFEQGNSNFVKIASFWNTFFADLSHLFFYKYLHFIQTKLLKLFKRKKNINRSV
jgi:hypothetical protein